TPASARRTATLAPPAPELDLKLRYALSVVPGAKRAMTTDADIVINGAHDFDHFGSSVVVADLDGDGFDDIIAGAPTADGPSFMRADCGVVYIIHGGPSMPGLIELSAPSPGPTIQRIIGRRMGDGLGRAIAAGDVDGDGRLDLVLGSPLADGRAGALGALDVGDVAVLPGAAPSASRIDLKQGPTPAGWTLLRGDNPGDQAGSSVAVGDFDGDGIDDIAVAARGADGPDESRPDAGEVFLIMGRPSMLRVARLSDLADAVITSPNIGDLAGTSLAFGDIDGDGREDLVIGAELGDGRRDMFLDAGDVYVVAGRALKDLQALRPREGNGRKTSSARGPEATTPAASAPRAGPVAIDLASPKIPSVMRIHGVDPGDHTGVRAVGDLDGDERADLVLGAADSASRRNSRAGGGEVRVLAGGPIENRSIALSEGWGVSITGPRGNTHLGGAALVVDLDGDGRLELVAAGPQAGRALSGRVWILRADWRPLLHPSLRRKR
ncbi:MAG: hypothetical protein ACE5HU_07595, partial [Acidobacteriota bacterium]